jgi:hypothetical protein
VSDVKHLYPLGKSDYEVPVFELCLRNKLKREKKIKITYDFKHADFMEKKKHH